MRTLATLTLTAALLAACNRQPDELRLTPGPGALPAAPSSSGESGTSTIAAQHVLVAWRGSAAGNAATRTQAEARTRAEDVLRRARAGEDFGNLAAQFSDEPGHESRRGDLGSFARGAMVPPFERAAFALGVGQISDIVETQFGYHVIKRTR
jgi:NIMA-interacting peptidyl-prolyl cis-trans isomerase 1